MYSVRERIGQPISCPELSSLVLTIHFFKSGSLFRARKKKINRVIGGRHFPSLKTEELSVY